jgi:uncharacterized delta-60 repeat protein
LAVGASVALAAVGDPDPTFNGGQPLLLSVGPSGGSTDYFAAAKQADGKVVLVGEVAQSSASSNQWAITRVTQAGQLDGGFGSNGTVLLSMGSGTYADGVVIEPADQKIVVAGLMLPSGSTRDQIGVVRLNTNGSLDSTGFGSGGKVLLADSANSLVPGAIALRWLVRDRRI